MEKIYKVEFSVKRNGEGKRFVYVSAKNQKAAIEIARQISCSSRMVHITAKKNDMPIYYKKNTIYHLIEL